MLEGINSYHFVSDTKLIFYCVVSDWIYCYSCISWKCLLWNFLNCCSIISWLGCVGVLFKKARKDKIGRHTARFSFLHFLNYMCMRWKLSENYHKMDYRVFQNSILVERNQAMQTLFVLNLTAMSLIYSKVLSPCRY